MPRLIADSVYLERKKDEPSKRDSGWCRMWYRGSSEGYRIIDMDFARPIEHDDGTFMKWDDEIDCLVVYSPDGSVSYVG